MDRIERAQAVVDAAFQAHGSDAVYTAPDGSTADCRIIPHRYIRDRPKGGVSFTASGQMFELDSRDIDVLVRSYELAQPVTGGVFAVGARTWRIGDMPLVHDTLGLVWRCSGKADG